MSNVTRKPTIRRNVPRQNTANGGITLAPPPPLPFLPTLVASNSTNNIEHASMNRSQEETKKKQKKIDELADQVVPSAERGTKHPVIEHNGFEDYYRCRLDAPVFRYSSSNNNNNNNGDLPSTQTSANAMTRNVIVID